LFISRTIIAPTKTKARDKTRKGYLTKKAIVLLQKLKKPFKNLENTCIFLP